MIRTKTLVRALLLAPLLAGCSPHAPLKVQPTAGTDFSKYQTYAIKPGNVVFPGASAAERARLERMVQDAVAARLEARGLVPQPDEPDLVVTYTVGARGGGFGPDGGRPPVGIEADAPTVNPYDQPGYVQPPGWTEPDPGAELRLGSVEGNLVIDLLDGNSRRLVWRATSGLDLTPARRLRAIESVVDRAFADLPTLRAATRPQSAPSTQRLTDSPG